MPEQIGIIRPGFVRPLLCVLLLCLPLRALAQAGAADMDLLLDTGAVSFSAAALWLRYAAAPADLSNPEAAFALAGQNGLLPRGARPDKPLRLDELAFMFSRAFAFKGGLMYSLFPGPRYAYRELVYRKVLDGRTDPAQTVSGERFLYFLGRALEYRDRGGRQ